MDFLLVVVASILAANTVSGDGRHQAIVSSAGTIYYSADFGQAWVESEQIGITASIKALAFGTGAQSQVALTTSHQVMISQNFGNTWSEFESFPVGAWTAIAIASTGPAFIVAVGRAGLFYWYDTGYGATDTSMDGAENTWFVDTTAVSGSLAVGNVALNINCSLYQFSPSGSWTQINTPFAGQTALPMFGLSVSQTAVSPNNFYTYSIIATTSGVHFSNNAAQSWTTLFNNISGIPINGTAMSVDGQYQAVLYESQYAFVSTDYGQTWTNIYATLPGCIQDFSSLAMSPNGNGIIIGALTCQSVPCAFSTTLPYGKVWQQLCSQNVQWHAIVAIA